MPTFCAVNVNNFSVNEILRNIFYLFVDISINIGILILKETDAQKEILH